MKVENNIVLRYDGSPSLSPFSLKLGEAIMVFDLLPKKGEEHYIEESRYISYCPMKPYWIECTAYSLKKRDIKLINEHIEQFHMAGLFSNEKYEISQKVIDMLEGGDVRLLNLMLCKLKGESFIVVNVVGLSFDSIRRLLNFVVNDTQKNDVAYIIVEYNDIVVAKTNPIFLNSSTIDYVMEELVNTNSVRRSYGERNHHSSIRDY